MDVNKSLGERLSILMKHYGLNKNSLSNKLGLPGNSMIGRVVNDPEKSLSYELLQKIAFQFPQINVRWLMTGKGTMLGIETIPYEKGEIRYYKLDAGESFPESLGHKKANSILTIAGFKDCDYAFDMVGESMSPRFKHGDIILCTDQLHRSIITGEPYLIVSKGNLLCRVIKSITESTYKLSSPNPNYEDFELKTKDIAQLFIIKGIVRREVF